MYSNTCTRTHVTSPTPGQRQNVITTLLVVLQLIVNTNYFFCFFFETNTATIYWIGSCL